MDRFVTAIHRLQDLSFIDGPDALWSRGAHQQRRRPQGNAGATISAHDGTVLAEASALMVALLPHHS